MDTIENTKKDYFECFAFGDSPEMADELLALVLAGKKTATKRGRFITGARWTRQSSLCDQDSVSGNSQFLRLNLGYGKTRG